MYIRILYNAIRGAFQFLSGKAGVKRILALSKIAEKFELSVKYTEKEVNEIIRNSIVFTDIELIRREMFQHRFIGRLRDGSKYWLEEDWKSLYGDYLGEVRGAALDCGENRTEESE
ncbi:DUF2087 domain-containing protein [Acetatifactor muris]|uniref:DUF2087 domain-containing protein n=1 Tax=Acetatifactor muris TaxID=879566 RepID=UPI000CD267A5|nr:DUF2087 domain-containing protein [Acetatifactor muris]MCR2047654.1 DUF2087 domain-containing protein [Acetatifactor muris]